MNHVALRNPSLLCSVLLTSCFLMVAPLNAKHPGHGKNRDDSHSGKIDSANDGNSGQSDHKKTKSSESKDKKTKNKNDSDSTTSKTYIYKNSSQATTENDGRGNASISTSDSDNKKGNKKHSRKEGKNRGLPPGLQKKYNAGGVNALPSPWQDRVRNGEVDPREY
ncbi:MAG: hypothetical protein SGI71_00780 [Verrucomicrobiota bacterium]|nr:hypothetical protein [Verrucomicrobiota bacterium]